MWQCCKAPFPFSPTVPPLPLSAELYSVMTRGTKDIRLSRLNEPTPAKSARDFYILWCKMCCFTVQIWKLRNFPVEHRDPSGGHDPHMLSFIVLYVMYPHTPVQCVCTLFNFGCTYCIYQFFLELEKILTVLVDCSDFRDSFYLCLLNSGTSFLSGFAIFSVLGYMSQKQGVDINSVAESGMKVIQF